jgi:hypothetical protein
MAVVEQESLAVKAQERSARVNEYVRTQAFLGVALGLASDAALDPDAFGLRESEIPDERALYDGTAALFDSLWPGGDSGTWSPEMAEEFERASARGSLIEARLFLYLASNRDFAMDEARRALDHVTRHVSPEDEKDSAA